MPQSIQQHDFGTALQHLVRTRYKGFCFVHGRINSTALAQAQKEAEEAAAQAAATEESRQKAVGMGKPIFARSLKPLSEPKDVEFHTAKRQRMQGDAQADKVHMTIELSTVAEDNACIEKHLKTSVSLQRLAWQFLRDPRRPPAISNACTL